MLHLGADLGLLEKVWCEGALGAVSVFFWETAGLLHRHISLTPSSHSVCQSHVASSSLGNC